MGAFHRILTRARAAVVLTVASSGCFLSAYSVEEGTAGGGGTGAVQASAVSAGPGGAGGVAATSTGAGGGCAGPQDCPPAAGACQTAACVDGACGLDPLPQGAVPAQVAGDCRSSVCDGAGQEIFTPAADPEDDGRFCTADTCAGDITVHAVQVGPCPEGVCDAGGNCVPMCLADSDCPAAPQCSVSVCQNGRCQQSPAASGTFCNGFDDQCDGLGNCVDCVNSGACGECCVCSGGTCVQARSSSPAAPLKKSP